MPSALSDILAKYRATAQTVRETGTYFEELIRTYFRYEASYADLYSDVWLWADWAKEIGTDHPFRIEAEERMELMQREFSRSAARLMELICAVDSHGRYITHDELYDLGATADIAMIVRVNEIEPETLRMQTWRSIDMGVCPF